MDSASSGYDSIKSSRTTHVYSTDANANFVTDMGAPVHCITALSAVTLVLTCSKIFPGSATESITLQAGQTLVGQYVAFTTSGSTSGATFLAQWA